MAKQTFNAAQMGGSAPTPKDFTGLKLWLRADALSFASGATVSVWPDVSGFGNHAEEATNRPSFQIDVVNGKPVIRFDGSNDQLIVAATANLNFTNATIFVVRNNQANAASLSIAQSGTVDEEFLLYDKGIYHHSSAGGNVNLTHQTSPSGFFVQSARFGAAPTALELWLNGVASNQSVVSSGTPTNYTAVTRAAYIGWRSGVGTERLNGDIAEIVVFDSQLSTASRQAIEDYLGSKYAITVTH